MDHKSQVQLLSASAVLIIVILLSEKNRQSTSVLQHIIVTCLVQKLQLPGWTGFLKSTVTQILLPN